MLKPLSEFFISQLQRLTALARLIDELTIVRELLDVESTVYFYCVLYLYLTDVIKTP